MANRQKYTRGAIGHLCSHFERKKEKNGEYLKFGNQDIDLTKSHMNYNLAATDQPLPQLDFIHKRMKECSCLNRKDVNVMMSWCVTLPERMNHKSYDDQLKFFELTYNFLKKRYGKENVISAWVHLDESGQPHMHFAYTPVMYDKAKNKYKFNAKMVGSNKDLVTFHKDIDQYLTKSMGYETGVITGETEINMTIKELKEISKRLVAFESELKKAMEVEEPQKTMGVYKSSDVQNLVEDVKTLKGVVYTLNEENTLLKAHIQRLESNRDVKRYLALKSAYDALESKFERFIDIVENFLMKFKLNHVFEEFKRISLLYNDSSLASRTEYIKQRQQFDKKYGLMSPGKDKGYNIER